MCETRAASAGGIRVSRTEASRTRCYDARTLIDLSQALQHPPIAVADRPQHPPVASTNESRWCPVLEELLKEREARERGTFE